MMRNCLKILFLWFYLLFFSHARRSSQQQHKTINRRQVQSPATCGYYSFYDELIRRNTYLFQISLAAHQQSIGIDDDNDSKLSRLNSIAEKIEQRCNEQWSERSSDISVRYASALVEDGRYRLDIDIITRPEADQDFPIFKNYDCILSPEPEVEELGHDDLSWPSSCGIIEVNESLLLEFPFSREEDKHLLRLRRQGKSWREIAEDFPQRHWITLVKRYYKLPEHKQIRSKDPRPYNFWTAEEDDKLLEAKELGFSWTEIAELFNNKRSQGSLRSRYQLFNGPPKTRIYQYTREEDRLLLSSVKAGLSWSETEELFEGERSVHSLQTRLRNLEAKDKDVKRIRKLGGKKLRYTPEEDELIIQSRAAGLTWNQVAAKFEGDRDVRALKARYYLLSENPNSPAEKSSPPYTPDEEKLLLEARAAGLSWKDTTALFEGRRNQASLQAHLYKLKNSPDSGLAKPSKRRTFTNDEVELILRERNNGKPFKDIAELFPGRSSKSIENRYYKTMKERKNLENNE